MAQAKAARLYPGVFRTAGRAWRSTGLALLRMPLAFLVTVGAVALLRVGSSYAAALQTRAIVAAEPADNAPGGPALIAAVLVLGLYVLRMVALAPLAVAVHRFVLLGERASLLPLKPAGRVLHFAGWMIVLGLLSSLPDLIAVPKPSAAAATWKLAIAIAAAVAATRLVLVFPAVAVGVGTTPLSLSWHKTRWQFWRITAVLLLTVAVAQSLAGCMLLLAVRLAPAAMARMNQVTPLLYAIIAGIDVALGAAAASWLFAGYGLKRETETSYPERTRTSPTP